MNGKFDSNRKQKATASDSNRRDALIWGVSFALVALAIVMVVLSSMGYLDPKPSGSQQTAPSGNTEPQSSGDLPQQNYTDPEESAASGETLPAQDDRPDEPGNDTPGGSNMGGNDPDEWNPDKDVLPEGTLFHLGDGIYVTEYISYTGAFMEDRTDQVVTDVLGIRITNTGDTCVQTMDVTLTDGETQAVFSLSTLLPGDTVVALEKTRMAYSSAPKFTQAQTSSVALFSEMPTLCEDLVEIQCLNGIINVTNISGEDLTEDICIYYKNCVNGVYYGGLTYRLRISGGLKAGEIRQGSAAHFDPDNSAVVFVTCD